ncbi:MAG: hypothetical protein QOD30_1925 [Actinomycetota bacterium]|nr:hypothetical protein [Actinomycetota bacterium]
MSSDRLPHGYTNLTRRLDDGCVEKRYVGLRRFANARREAACLAALAGVVPVPEVVEVDLDEPRLVTRWIEGSHGQDLVNAGDATAVLRVIGETLRSLQSVSTSTVDLDGDGLVISHGDFGAQNVLFDATGCRVVAIIDWESAYLGDPIDDLAFAEWVIRMHHHDRLDYLDALFDGVGWRPPWTDRQSVMLRKCEFVRRLCQDAGMSESEAWWRSALAMTEAWRE